MAAASAPGYWLVGSGLPRRARRCRGKIGLAAAEQDAGSRAKGCRRLGTTLGRTYDMGLVDRDMAHVIGTLRGFDQPNCSSVTGFCNMKYPRAAALLSTAGLSSSRGEGFRFPPVASHIMTPWSVLFSGMIGFPC